MSLPDVRKDLSAYHGQIITTLPRSANSSLLDASLCSWLIFHHLSLIDPNTDLVRLWVILSALQIFTEPFVHQVPGATSGEHSFIYCYPNNAVHGWCRVDMK